MFLKLFRATTILTTLMILITAAAAPPARAATEVARIPWYASGSLAFVNSYFRYSFPLIAANRRLDVQFVSCSGRFEASDGAPSETFLGVNDAADATLRRHVLNWSSRAVGSAFYSTISQPVVFAVYAGERPQIAFQIYAGGGTVNLSTCALSGELVFLQ